MIWCLTAASGSAGRSGPPGHGLGLAIAQVNNDAIASVASRYPERFAALASAPLDAGADGGAVDGGAVDGSPMPARPGQGCGCVVGARPVRTPGALPVALGLLGALVLYRRRRVVE